MGCFPHCIGVDIWRYDGGGYLGAVSDGDARCCDAVRIFGAVTWEGCLAP